MGTFDKLGMELARIRSSHGYSVERLSSETGVASGLIRIFEQGSRDIPLIEAMILFDHLNEDFVQVYLALAKRDGQINLEVEATAFDSRANRRKQMSWRIRSTIKTARRTTANSKRLLEEHRDLQLRASAACKPYDQSQRGRTNG